MATSQVEDDVSNPVGLYVPGNLPFTDHSAAFSNPIRKGRI